jgi:tRNA(Arg) A34 adenosine deaminase TadA
MRHLNEFLDNVPNKLRKGFNYAYVAALSSGGVGGRGGSRFRLGAVICDGSTPLAAGFNSYKTHPFLSTRTPYPHIHAESACLIKLGLDNSEGKNLFVVRIKADGSLGLAKPCDVCTTLIKEANIKNCYYSASNAEMSCL